MSKRQFKSQASSSRAGGTFETFGSSAFGASHSSVLSYVQEPPDYSSLSDPNIVVAFKNLSKKDATTKAKALEDLHSHIGSTQSPIEDSFLDAWARLFPRLSIDPSRRVRQLAHVLNGGICSKCGKRTVRHMPRISGPWLAGTQDSDRAAARAAQDALQLVFPSPEKIHGVRKAFQRPILEYCRDAALYETTKTLSDERTVSSDDAEATYARVVSSSLSVIGMLVRSLGPDDEGKCVDVHEDILGNAKFWELASSKHPMIRRALHRLMSVYLLKQGDLIRSNSTLASTAYVYKGLPSEQDGSALDFVQALSGLTQEVPAIWTEAYTGKKSAISRLKQCLKRGSQGSSAAYWDGLNVLLRNIPREIFLKSRDDAVELLSTARTGVSKREERLNGSSAWLTYFTLVEIVTTDLPSEDRGAIFDSEVMPLVRNYLEPSPSTTDWSIGGAKPATIVSAVASIPSFHPILVSQWPSLGDKLVETAKMSQPEQSKDFDKSQKQVAAAGQRWSLLQREFLKGDYSFSQESLQSLMAVNVRILTGCIGLLKTRRGKPYGSAAIVEELLRSCGQQLLQNEEFSKTYSTFATEDLPALAFSPSLGHLINGLYAVSSEKMFNEAFTATLQEVLNADVSPQSKSDALQLLFPSNMPPEAVEVAKGDKHFQSFVLQHFTSPSAETSATFFADLVKLKVVSADTIDGVLSNLTASLSVSDRQSESLTSLDAIADADDTIIRSFMAKSGGVGEQLLPQVLQLEQSADDASAEKAAALASKLSSAIGGASSGTKFGVVLQNLERVTQRSLHMDSLYDLVDRMLGNEKKVQSAQEVLPNLDIWAASLSAAIRRPKASLALLSPLGGVLHMVGSPDGPTAAVQCDSEGLSQALRIAMYIARMLTETDLISTLNGTTSKVFLLLHMSVLVAEDNISILGTNSMWKPRSGPDTEAFILEFIAEANTALRRYWDTLTSDVVGQPSTEYAQYAEELKEYREQYHPSSPECYYVASAYARTHSNLFETHGHTTEQAKAVEELLRQARSKKQIIETASCLVAFQQPLAGTQTLTRYCNELVADLTDIDPAEQSAKALEKISLLNVILRTQEEAVEMIAKQRLIFLVKHLLPWLEADIPAEIKTEACFALGALLPGMADMYGEHWEQALSFLCTYWLTSEGSTREHKVSENTILLTSASLRLFVSLKKLSKTSEPNDDLVDALKDKEDDIYTGLVQLLKCENEAPDDAHMPLMAMHELLARQIAQLPYKALDDIDELYALLYSPSHAIQQAAFGLLHQHIPVAQEQISFDAALENKTAHLPDELLSLILEAPTLESLADASFHRRMPLSLQGYLSSWRLLFDHFDGSSYRVKNDYVEQIKEGGYLSGFLSFAFDFLGHSRGKPVEASKFDIPTYTADSEPEPERDVQWLLTHLYFLALTHLPSLVKAYYLEIRSRQTVLAVESWTAKFISPLVIGAALHAVAAWAESSVKEDPEYEKMSVKVGVRSKEINVGYVVDEQTMAIRIVLPEAYPLEAAKVLGVSRVAVKEEKWQSWLRNCQGVIAFSNGSITDGLAAWRRNVTGALKGQTECAICYSIISGDKQLPTKRCPTCKHLFHSSCLFKWFKTSNANTCPLCRNPFQFN